MVVRRIRVLDAGKLIVELLLVLPSQSDDDVENSVGIAVAHKRGFRKSIWRVVLDFGHAGIGLGEGERDRPGGQDDRPCEHNYRSGTVARR